MHENSIEKFKPAGMRLGHEASWSSQCNNKIVFLAYYTFVLYSGGAATVFALTTCTSASMREKNDSVNWALGGAASGIFMGFASKLSESQMPSINGWHFRFFIGLFQSISPNLDSLSNSIETRKCPSLTVGLFHWSYGERRGTFFQWSAHCTLCVRQMVPVQILARVTVLCSWARHFTLVVPLSTQVYKWVPTS